MTALAETLVDLRPDDLAIFAGRPSAPEAAARLPWRCSSAASAAFFFSAELLAHVMVLRQEIQSSYLSLLVYAA